MSEFQNMPMHFDLLQAAHGQGLNVHSVLAHGRFALNKNAWACFGIRSKVKFHNSSQDGTQFYYKSELRRVQLSWWQAARKNSKHVRMTAFGQFDML